MNNQMPEIKAIGESFNNLMESLGSKERIKELEQTSEVKTMYGKTFHIDRYSGLFDRTDITIIQDGEPVYLSDVSVTDAESISMFMADFAKGEL